MSNFRLILGRLLPLFILSVYFYVGSCSSSGPHVDPLTQQKLARVGRLPGQNFDVDFAHYSGYITVNEKAGRAFFYWFFEADEDPSSKPLVLWLNGGPGCSSIGFGVAAELGPFHIRPDGESVYLNPHAWNKAANVLFLDSPAGVGFSYSNTSSDLITNGDTRTAQDNLKFLLGWFELFPQYKGRDFYITGESYGGHYVPQLSQAIVRHNSATKKTINLRGYMVGNAVTNDFYDRLGLFQYMWSTGLISDETYKLLTTFCGSESFVHLSKGCRNILDIVDNEFGDIDHCSIYTPACTVKSSLSHKLLKRLEVNGHLNEGFDPCTQDHAVSYFNLPEVQKAIHVDPQFAPATWYTCSDDVFTNWTDSPKSVLDVHLELINAGLRIWMFSGSSDAVIPVTSTRYSIDALKLPTAKPWHAWYDDGQVAGWTQEYQGLTFVVVKGGGHEVPLYQPKASLILIKSFLAGESMPTVRQVSDS